MKTIPKWVKAIPEGSHGSGTIQKRLWKLISDYVRIRDWYKYKTCAATGNIIRHWSEGDAGHFIAYSVCRGMYKFSEDNVFLQSPNSNAWGGMEIGHSMGEELKRRGIDPDELKRDNYRSQLKVNDTLVIEKMRDIIQKMGELKEQPKYYPRVMKLYEKET